MGRGEGRGNGVAKGQNLLVQEAVRSELWRGMVMRCPSSEV